MDDLDVARIAEDSGQYASSSNQTKQPSEQFGYFDIPAIEPCFQYITIVAELENMITLEQPKFSKDQVAMSQYWDSRMVSRFQGTSFADLDEYHQMNPLVDPRRWLNLLVYEFVTWLRMRDHLKRMRTEVCVEVPASPYIWATSEKKQARYVNADLGDDQDSQQRAPIRQVPTVSRVLEGINEGEFILWDTVYPTKAG